MIIHFFGMIGIMFFNRSWFIALTPVNLLFMFLLTWQTHQNKGAAFYLFFTLCWCTGMIVEIVGVQTGILFGSYLYGDVLGPGIFGVPFLIGVNWFIIVYCSAAIAERLIPKRSAFFSGKIYVRDFLFCLAGSAITTIFDWMMEPVAIKLDYWSWKNDGSIPVLNYICWFSVSFFLLLMLRFLKLQINNRFAISLLIIQALFFIVLRIFFHT